MGPRLTEKKEFACFIASSATTTRDGRCVGNVRKA
jgi:hypothetical protein